MSENHSPKTLKDQILLELPRRLSTIQAHNLDPARLELHLPPMRKFRSRLRRRVFETLKSCASGLGLVPWRAHHADQIVRRLDQYLPMMDDLDSLYQDLVNDQSRKIMLDVILMRILGARHVRFDLNSDAYWSQNRKASQLPASGPQVAWCGLKLSILELPGTPPIRIQVPPQAILNTFWLGQYEYDRDGIRVRVEPGDIAIDCGACLGDTTLCFADGVGPEGKVMAFEFVPGNLSIMESNIELNPHLASRIHLVRHPLWSHPGEMVEWSADGPGSVVGRGPEKCRSESIDHVVSEHQYAKVDFIKMDIEGAELPALEGARETLLKFHPKLALSVYHRDDDLVRIPAFFRELGLKYRWALDHFTVHAEETVLFGLPVDSQNSSSSETLLNF